MVIAACAEHGIGLRIAAALVSPNGHNRIRRQPIFLRRFFQPFKHWKGKLWKGNL
jgi:hypothetical protein